MPHGDAFLFVVLTRTDERNAPGCFSHPQNYALVRTPFVGSPLRTRLDCRRWLACDTGCDESNHQVRPGTTGSHCAGRGIRRRAHLNVPAAGSIGAIQVQLADALPVDRDRAAHHLSEAVRFRTVSHQDASQNDVAEWDRFHAWLQETYPTAHAAMTREVVAGHTLVYTWPGDDPARAPVILMAHQDVVPVTPGTESDWRHGPFDGVIDDGAVWGRGSVDNKSSLIALFEAIEALAVDGFAPAASVIVLSGHDEEAGGSGAAAAAALLRDRGVHAEFALDEGLAIVADFPLLGRPVALIGIAEKGYGTLRVTAAAAGGHSSAPPSETGVATLARAVLAITERPFEMRFQGPRPTWCAPWRPKPASP